MSDSRKEISKLDDADVDDDDQGAGDGGGVQTEQSGGVHVEQSGGFVNGSFRKAKKVVLFPIAMAKKQFYHRRNKQRQEENKRVSFAAVTAANDGADAKGCCFCFKQPHTLESPAQSFTSDPNDSSFTYDMLKSFIEKNDFYSKECNPHSD